MVIDVCYAAGLFDGKSPMRAPPRKPSHAYPQKTASQNKENGANHAFQCQTKAERAVEIKSGHIDSATLGT